MKKIVIYYSYSGNTRRIAQLINEKKGYDVWELKPLIPFVDDYQKLVDQEEENMHQNKMVELEPINVELNNYDTIILGTPVWWYTMASPVRTFLVKCNLTNKVIIPFATNAGWPGSVIEDIEKYASKCKVEKPISIVFNGQEMIAEKDVLDWINNL